MSEDSLAPLVTQCPNCTTRFKVMEAQLQVAGGRVRCGACLTVFDGTEHLLVDGELLQPGSGDEVDALLDELANPEPVADVDAEADEELAAVTQAGEPQEDTDTGTLNDEHQSSATVDLPAVDGSELAARVADPEEISGTDLPADLTALEAQFMAELHGEEPAELPRDEPGAGPSAESGSGEDEYYAPDNSWVESAVDDVWAGDETQAPEDTDSEDKDSENKDSEDKAPGPDEVDQTADKAVQDSAEVSETAVAPALVAEKSAATDVTLRGEDALEEPAALDRANLASARPPAGLEIDTASDTETPARKPWLTWVFIGLAVIGLPAQVLWFQYESWVTDLTFRPVYQVLCQIAGCELPPMRDTRLIESRKSVSRSHPQQPNLRVVDLLMVNNADFAQPFPVVQVSFSALDGQLVASRRFAPEEYLRGDMVKVRLMPPRTPIHVSMELADPGADAQSFRIQFH